MPAPCRAVHVGNGKCARQVLLPGDGQGYVGDLVCRLPPGALNIPMLFLMNRLVGICGMIRVQLIIEVIMLPFMLGMYFYTICNYLKSHAQTGERIFYNICSDEEKSADPSFEDEAVLLPLRKKCTV